MRRWVFSLVVSIGLAGCSPYVESLTPGEPAAGGVYHRVEGGETLWRIANQYGVELSELVRVNRISDASRIETGQTLYIPTRSRAEEVSNMPERPAGLPPSVPLLREVHHEEFTWPVDGKVISIFGMRRGATLNKGIDIQASQGTDVSASRSGVVSFVHEALPGFGKTLIVDHEDGFATVYAYLGEILVQKGERVVQHQVIARIGATGRADVPALHFEIRRHEKPENPFYYLP